MTTYELLRRRRSIRRFKSDPVPQEILEKIADSGRYAPSGMNMQPLEFIIINHPDVVTKLYEHTLWARYLPPEIGHPPSGKHPTAFIVILINEQKSPATPSHDVGAAVENMILVALENSIGSCWIASVTRNEVKKLLSIPDFCTIDSVIALGYPDEAPVPVEFKGSVKYWRDKNDIIYVPKRELGEVLHQNKY